MADQLAYFSVFTGGGTVEAIYSYDTVTSAIAMVGNPFLPGNFVITPNFQFIYSLTPTNPNTLVQINLTTNTNTTIALGGSLAAFDLCIDPAGTFIYILDNSANAIYQFSLTSLTVVATLPITGAGTTPTFISMAPNGSNLYVSGSTKTGGRFFVTVVGLPAFTTTTNIMLPATTSGGLNCRVTVGPTSAVGYIASYDASSTNVIIVVLNLVSNTVTASITAFAGGAVIGAFAYGQFDASNNLYYPVNEGAPTTNIVVIATATNTLVTNVALSGNTQGLGITSSFSELISTDTRGSTAQLTVTALPGFAQTTVTTAGTTQFLVMGQAPTSEQIVMIL